ncbi:11432_t:CDS:2, partial [Dentiscutata erythropus]
EKLYERKDSEEWTEKDIEKARKLLKKYTENNKTRHRKKADNELRSIYLNLPDEIKKDQKEIFENINEYKLYKNYYYLVSYNETSKKVVIKIGKITNKEIINNKEKTLFKLVLNNAIEEAKKRICEKIIKKHQNLFDEIKSKINTCYKEEFFEFLDSTIEDFVTNDIDKFIFASIFRTFTKYYYFHVPVSEEHNMLTEDEKIFFKNLLTQVIEYYTQKFDT